MHMRPNIWALATASVLLIGVFSADAALAQKHGGTLTVYLWDSPASMSIHEEATYSTVVSMMGVFNNLVMYKQDEPQNTVGSIVPPATGHGARMEPS
jgi:peptide/nickel transport system substrate-binding protein